MLKVNMVCGIVVKGTQGIDKPYFVCYTKIVSLTFLTNRKNEDYE